MKPMIVLADDGRIIIRRSEYIWRDGIRDEDAYRRMGDGDIITPIHADAYKDFADAKEIIDWITSL